MNQDKKHKISIHLDVVVDDGLEVPLHEPLTDEERNDLGVGSLAAALEICMFLRNHLESIGVTVELSTVNDCYTISSTNNQKGKK